MKYTKYCLKAPHMIKFFIGRILLLPLSKKNSISQQMIQIWKMTLACFSDIANF